MESLLKEEYMLYTIRIRSHCKAAMFFFGIFGELIFEKIYRRESMRNRGQAALEYLMTYGWALIVIAIVVGVLVFIVSSPTGDIICNSDQPNKIMVRASQITTPGTAGALTALGEIQITNLTGGNIASNLTCTGTGGFSTTGTIGCPEDGMVSGEQVTLKPIASATADTYATSSIVLGYDDYAGLTRSARITCSGPLILE